MAVTLRLSSGYTLIELLTVIAITAILSLAAVQILLQGQLRSSQAEAMAAIRQEGNAVLDALEFELRNSRSAVCTSNTLLTVTTTSGRSILYTLNSTAIASDSSSLTTGDVVASDLQFTCEDSSSTSGTLVNISFALTTPELQRSITDFSQQFRTSVYVRQFN